RPSSRADVLEFFIKPIDREPFLQRLRDRLPGLFGAEGAPRVLVVDDDPAARKLLGDLLRERGAAVREAAGGQEALAALAGEVPALLLLDLLMPDTDGFAVIEQVRGPLGLAALPVVVVTAKDLDSGERESLQGRIQALWQKTLLTPEGLREQL